MTEMNDLNDLNRRLIEEYRATGGNVGGQFAGAPLLLLTTTGAKSGKPRTRPLAYLSEGGRIYVFAGNRGAPTNPAWYHNLVAHPDVAVELGTEKFAATAIVLDSAEGERLGRIQLQKLPALAELQAKITRPPGRPQGIAPIGVNLSPRQGRLCPPDSPPQGDGSTIYVGLARLCEPRRGIVEPSPCGGLARVTVPWLARVTGPWLAWITVPWLARVTGPWPARTRRQELGRWVGGEIVLNVDPHAC